MSKHFIVEEVVGIFEQTRFINDPIIFESTNRSVPGPYPSNTINIIQWVSLFVRSDAATARYGDSLTKHHTRSEPFRVPKDVRFVLYKEPKPRTTKTVDDRRARRPAGKKAIHRAR
ncbi:hypothetical protein GWI33_004616 [Rhynchophorus ferrugineus]|uniref:Uncharacterized protein n=1 Tax=Rhynchophorus ferrugineus TaxID=354439 RepID=A0A834ML51_RHYFE|nr:hypothetical protein GWI33_004616 [Rhynchophorus ferrugineus]